MISPTRTRGKCLSAACICLFLLLTGILPASAQQNAPFPLQLRNQTLLLPANARTWMDSIQRSAPRVDPVQVLIQLEDIPDAERRSALAGQGIRLLDFVSGTTFSAMIDPSASLADPVLASVRSVLPVQPRWKLVNLEIPNQGSRELEVLVAFDPALPRLLIEQKIAQYQGRILGRALAEHGYYELTIQSSSLLALAGWYGVRTINPAAHDQPLNFESTTATKTNLAHMPVLSGGHGLLGEGMTIGVGDNTSGVNHIDLRDRIINYNPAVYTNHGMHINGIVGGAGIVDPRARGFAPHATLVDHLYNLVWARTGTMLQDHNMTVTNNSYAAVVGDCNFEGTYDAYSQALDTISLQYNTVLHVFAAGNDGSLNCPPYPLGFGTITGGYQPAKNVLVVAQTDKRYNWGINSSRGPVKDGRLKPEITAIGTEVLSTRGGDNYLISGGTSMSSPQVAGAAALVGQRYKQLFSNANPRADLVKTLLMNGAMDIGNPGPDFTFGFGMMDMGRTLLMLDSGRYLLNSVLNNGQQTVSIQVPPNTAQLKVMLYWNDVPASPVALKQLVNDLDLEVTDPAALIHLPLILNPAPAQVTNNAVPGTDRLNNVEQVTINAPAAGSYSLRVKGYAVPAGPQSYVLAYDFIPVGIQLTYPATGAQVKAGDSLRIYWDASPDPNPFTLEFSDNNGSSWTLLSNSIPATQRYFTTLVPPGTSSAQCQVRLSRNNTAQQSLSGNFVTNPGTLLQLSADQCPGYLTMHWSPVPNASGYQVLRKKGIDMEVETVVIDTSYTFSNLSLDSSYYAAVRPLIGGAPGYRSLAVRRQPNDGSCNGSFSDGDLMVERIEAPQTGRLGTSTALSNNETLSVRLRNLDNIPATSYRISYAVNGAWQSQNFNTPIPAAGWLVMNLGGLNLSAAGAYNLQVAVTNLALTDPLAANDTMLKTVRQLPNPPVNLLAGFSDGFESAPAFSLLHDSVGITSTDRWDFYNSNDTGRLRSFINDDITISGQRSFSMDVLQQRPAVTNYLTGTFNASAYTVVTDEVRMEFDYKLHGIPRLRDSNQVWVRGADTQAWLPLLYYDTTVNPGKLVHSGTRSLTDVLNLGGQQFSSSTQLRFGQRDSSLIAANDYGNGLTLDNVKLYTVQNDMELVSILSPLASACNLGSATPLTVRLYNGVAQTLNNVQLYYRLDNGSPVNETLPSITGKTFLNFTFSQALNTAAPGVHTLSVWLAASGDTYSANDSILNDTFRNQPLITSFPYLQNFDSSEGYWYSEGRNNSWQYGNPASANVQKAASGTKAWKTNLTGNYNDQELSYLYSPCFDISGLTSPMLSFSSVISIENCGSILCDAAWMEYSVDGGNIWLKLGAAGQGYGWYNDNIRQIWNQQGDNRWQVRSVPLPATNQPLRLRYVLSSDPGTGMEGLAIDDIHVFNLSYPIYDGTTTGPVTQPVSGSTFTTFLQGGKILAQIHPAGQSLGNTDVRLYTHTSFIDSVAQQYFLPENFVVNTATQPIDSVTARLYITDSAVLTMIRGTGCNTCDKAKDVYELGITKYDDLNLAKENGSLQDNGSGVYTFYPYGKIHWVPYDQGYYAEVKLPSFSELWFNTGGPTNSFPLPVAAVDFEAYKLNGTTVQTNWLSHIDTQISFYELQRSSNAVQFTTVVTVPSQQRTDAAYQYQDRPVVGEGAVLYYRIKWTRKDGKEFYSSLRQIDWTGANQVSAVFPNPSHDGAVNIRWSGEPGTVLNIVATDMLGKVIFEGQRTSGQWNNTSSIRLGGTGSGFYFLRLSIGERVFVHKVLFQ